MNGKAPTGSPKKSTAPSNRSKDSEIVNDAINHNGDSNEKGGDEENAAAVDVSLVIIFIVLFLSL